MHPLFENSDNLSTSEIEDKILLLNRRYYQTRNPQVQEQISMLLDTYKLELETRMVAEKKRQQDQQNGESGLDNLINIS
jgi:hypothetical protein